ncbi:MAG: hypothetical protein H6Q90_6389 [Deltaproteobacteria bacterium]|nr:hypothetical protein [Deltaproteobacteria bacterium]
MLKHGLTMFSILVAIAGCGKKQETQGETPAVAKPSTDDKATANTPPPADKVVAEPTPAPAPVPTGPAPSETKDMLGLELKPMGAWKPTWDADAKVAKWENEAYMTGIVIRIVKDKLDTIDDLKEAAPMMMQLGTAITKVVEEKKTDKGWYAIVEDDGGKTTEMVYIQKFGGTQLVCSGNVTKRKDEMSAGGIKKEEVIKACESIKVKP